MACRRGIAPPDRMTDAPPAPHRPLRDFIDLGLTLVVGLIAALVFRTLAYQPFTIPSSSMEPGLEIGDYIIVSKLAYGWSAASLPAGRPGGEGRLLGRQPQRGDVVVFRLPRDPEQVWVKRVVGLPGDAVQVRGGTVFVDGRPLRQTPLTAMRDVGAMAPGVTEAVEILPDGRRYVVRDQGPGQVGDDTPVFHVPAGRYLVMGDNRDNSLDGRWSGDIGVGLLPAQNIVGKAELIAASWRPGASLLKPSSWLNLRWNRFLTPIR